MEGRHTVQSNTSKNTHGFGDNKSPALLKINKNTNNVYNDEPQSSELWGHLSIKGKYSTCFGSIYYKTSALSHYAAAHSGNCSQQ